MRGGADLRGTLKTVVLEEHKLVWNPTQAQCHILTTQACV
jgi:hypothetical protein